MNLPPRWPTSTGLATRARPLSVCHPTRAKTALPRANVKLTSYKTLINNSSMLPERMARIHAGRPMRWNEHVPSVGTFVQPTIHRFLFFPFFQDFRHRSRSSQTTRCAESAQWRTLDIYVLDDSLCKFISRGGDYLLETSIPILSRFIKKSISSKRPA